MTQRSQKITNHLPPIAGKEPSEMTEGEEADDDEVEDDGDCTESDFEVRDYVQLPRGLKRGATSSSQSPPEEGVPEEEEDETNSPPDGKGPAKEADAPRVKRLCQIVLEGAMELRRPLQAALDAGARVGPSVKTLPMVK
jgi:hypothetical protein